YHFLFKLIPLAIFIILSKPSLVKCSLFFTNSATEHQSLKSCFFIPCIEYLLK
ncbi:MAG: hypothetical protein FE78DRAFT_130037, partial [Acidomyces sp. 'richmondensis']